MFSIFIPDVAIVIMFELFFRFPSCQTYGVFSKFVLQAFDLIMIRKSLFLHLRRRGIQVRTILYSRLGRPKSRIFNFTNIAGIPLGFE